MKTEAGGYEFIGVASLEIFANNGETITLQSSDEGCPIFITIRPSDVPMVCRVLKKIAREIIHEQRAEVEG